MNEPLLLDELSKANPMTAVSTSEEELRNVLNGILSAPDMPEPWWALRLGARRSVVSRSRSRRERARRGATAAAFIVAASVGTAGASSHWFSARTSENSRAVDPGDSSEILRMDGGDINQIIDILAQRIPLPPGGDFDDFKVRTAGDEPARESELGLRSSLESVATCQWSRWWLDAFARHDDAQMARGQRVLAEIPRWPGTRAATDIGDKPIARVVADAAALRDPAVVRQAYQANCAVSQP